MESKENKEQIEEKFQAKSVHHKSEFHQEL